jgi:hypothetical protein
MVVVVVVDIDVDVDVVVDEEVVVVDDPPVVEPPVDDPPVDDGGDEPQEADMRAAVQGAATAAVQRNRRIDPGLSSIKRTLVSHVIESQF